MWDPWYLDHISHRETFDHPETYDFVEISQNNHQRAQDHWAGGEIATIKPPSDAHWIIFLDFGN